MSFRAASAPYPIRVSDLDRERTAGLLREHHLAGRLTLGEFEDRVAETWRARFTEDLWRALRELPVAYPSSGSSSGCGLRAGLALAFGVMGTVILAFSFGLFWPMTLTMCAPAWALGRSARRAGTRGQGVALTGEILGMLGTAMSLLVLAGCAAIVA